MKILVFSDKLGNYAELCAGAKSLGGDVIAFAVCGRDEASKIGADKVYQADIDGSRMIEDYFATLKDVVSKEEPSFILMSSTKRSKFMAARLAASLGTSALTDLNNITVDGNSIKGTQMYYGGLALRTLKSRDCAIVTIGAGVFEAVSSQTAGEVIGVTFIDGASKIVRKEIRSKEGKSVNLGAAKKVVGAGRGIAKKEDLVLVENLAAVIGGEVGCSRPIAEGEGWMDVSRYIGVSGVMLKPDVYIAVGISGQVQHTIGISSARTIIAVNKDKNSPIFKVCDYGIVGDLYKILPALTDMIKAG